MGRLGNAKGLRVLVADDDERSLSTLQEIVELEGHRPIAVCGGLEAVAVARAQRIDLSVLDVNMPDLDGPEVLREMRRIHAVLPCIFVTGDVSPAAEARAREAGGFAVLRKPLELGLFRGVFGELVAQLAWLWRVGGPFPGGAGPFPGRA
ncbi:MAG: response regulator [Planctomycetes bacterium]|nr:response regulator [Planctomycetota bacterium]